MFTGIIESVGKIVLLERSNECIHFTITRPQNFNDIKIGDSISVNGVCLTITALTNSTFTFTAVPETLNLTNLSLIKINDLVNLERSLTLNTRLGGHLVQGHVDCIGEIVSIETNGDALLVKISFPDYLQRYIINKGYICLDGMSITVIETKSNWFTVTFIPHTQQATVIPHYKIGTKINIEVDMMAKYVEKLAGVQHANKY